MSEQNYIDRPPRLQPKLPYGEQEIPAPPEKEARQQPLWQLALPALTIGGYLLLSIFGRGRSLLMMIPMGLSVFASILGGLYLSKQGQREQEKAEAAYSEHLVDLRQKMMQEQEMQRRFYHYNYPDPEKMLQIALTTSRETLTNTTTPYTVSRLWERRTTDADFVTLRLGVGTRPSTVQYVLKDGGSIEDPQLRDALRLAEDSKFVDDVPITISLRSLDDQSPDAKQAVSARYAIGITGQHRKAIYAFVRALLVDYATFQAPADARLYVLGQEEAQWQWVSLLPHCQSDKPNEVICFEAEADREGDKEQNKAYRFLRAFRHLLDERRLRLLDPGYKEDVTLPHLLLVVDLLTTPPEDSILHDVETDPAISLIMQEGDRLGASVIFLVPAPRKVPSDCQAVVEVDVIRIDADVDIKPGARIHFRYTETGVNTPRFSGEGSMVQHLESVQQFAQALKPLAIRRSYGSDLPRSVHLLDMLRVGTMEELRQLLQENWRDSQLPENAEWLRVPLGMLLGGDYRTLRFSADEDGVHGLVAGSTGSGKSELLMTMILGLAVNYDPSIVNFVLVDFKGGGAFKPLEGLPHVVDVVTNLGESAVERVFAAITAELNKRQALNTRTNSKHLVHYRKRGLHLPDENGRYAKPVTIQDQSFETAPYPHLFVFIDEFAEMVANKPEYKAQLNSITRLGRALGVTLILAAQRPSGVTDQMRANIKFRIALRVETREDSSEVLRRPDAAYLPTGIPGRGYLQVGNENVELMQVAWSGADYTGEQMKAYPDVIWLDRESQKGKSKQGDDERPKVFEEMVKLMSKLAEDVSIRQRKPWPDFLQERMSLQTPIDASYLEDEMGMVYVQSGEDGRGQTAVLNPAISEWQNNSARGWTEVDWRDQAMKAVVGLIDNPYQSEQMPLVLNFRQGHVVIFGDSGWGKTTFLRTTVTTLATTHSPEQLHIYILDFGGRQMNLFVNLPHVGAVINADEEERVRRLLRKLSLMLEEYKRVITARGADNLYSYNANARDNEPIIPATLVIIDNFAEFKESFESLLPQLISLVRESRAWGIHFLISAETPNALSGKLYGLMTERLALRLADATEYTGIVGRGSRSLEEVPGRGFVRVERRPLEFQTALSLGLETELENEEGDTERLLSFVEILERAGQLMAVEKLPACIEILPTAVSLTDIVPAAWPVLPRLRPKIRPFVGIDDHNLEPWSFNLTDDGPHAIVIGTPNSGKTTFLRSLVLSLARSYSPDELIMVIIDYQGRVFHYGGNRSLEELPHVVETITNSDYIETLSDKLRIEMQTPANDPRPRRSIWVIIDNYESFSEDVRDKKGVMPSLSVLAREYGTSGLHFVIAGSAEVTRASDELRKQVQIPRFGIALDVEDVSRLNGSVPRALLRDELPVGRGFVIKSGRTFMVQFAAPGQELDSLERAMDEQVEQIIAHYPSQAAVWRQHLGDAAGEPKVEEVQPVVKTSVSAVPVISEEPKVEDGEAQATYVPVGVVPESVDIPALRKRLEDMMGASVQMLTAVDVYNTALSLGWISS